jgi:general secretion pathway protein I
MRAGIGDSGFGICKSGRPALACLAESRIPNPESRHQSGFSLLEVIAAILLLALAFTALMKVAGASAGLSRNAAAHSEAAMWARSKLDSAFVGQALQPGNSSGRFDATFRWQLAVTPWTPIGVVAAADAPLHLYQLDLQVLWGPPAHPTSAHFRTLRLSGLDAGNAGAGAQAMR